MSRQENIKNTVFSMFKKRGYSGVIFEDEKNQITGYCKDEKVIALISPVEKLNVDEIKIANALMTNEDSNHALIVYENVPTSAVKNAVGNMVELGLEIELWSADDLQFDITEHKLVPRHEKVDQKLVKTFPDKANLPILLKSDIVSRFYNYRKGEIIRVFRRDGTIVFRIVR